MATQITAARPVAYKSRVIAANARPRLRVSKTPIFKFKLIKKPVLYTKKVTLDNGGSVNVTVARGVSDYGKIVPKTQGSDSSTSGWNCVTTPWTGEVHSKEPIILNPNFDKLYPGAIYAYESIANGEYRTQPYARKPLTIFIDSVNNKTATVTVQQPSSGSIAQARNNIVNSAFKAGGSRSFGTRMEVLAQEDLFIRTGGSGYYLGFGGSHQIDYKNSSKSNKYFLEMYQAYYTISVDDKHNEPTDFFFTKAEQPNNKDAIAESLIDPNWVFVDSITYGRMLQIMFQSDESFESVGIDIEAHANFLVAGGQGTFNYKQQSVLNKTSVEVVAVGGSPIYSGQLLNAGNLQELKQRIDNFFSTTNDEKPIAFSLRTLDQETVGAKMITEFTSRQCAPKAGKYSVTWNKIVCMKGDDASGGEEVRAMTRIRAWNGKGEDIMDLDKINAGVITMAKTNLPVPWTFAKGDEDHPINMDTGDMYEFGKKIVFPVDPSDAKAKIAIRSDILEYDGWPNPNDDFTDALWEKKVTELAGPESVKLMCSHDASRIEFHFTVAPVYE